MYNAFATFALKSNFKTDANQRPTILDVSNIFCRTSLKLGGHILNLLATSKSAHFPQGISIRKLTVLLGSRYFIIGCTLAQGQGTEQSGYEG